MALGYYPDNHSHYNWVGSMMLSILFISLLCILPSLVALEVWSQSPVDAERELEREKAKRSGCPLLEEPPSSTAWPLTKIPPPKLNRLERVLGRLKSTLTESVAGNYCISNQ